MTIISLQYLMTESGVSFGTSGARGLVNQMTDSVCMAYTLAFLQGLQLAKPGATVALGMDLRPSSPDIAQACCAGIRHAGCQVDFCGVLPTPALALYGLEQGIPAIMITGSHIPFDRNGIKFYRIEGEISKADEAAISAAVIELPVTIDRAGLPDVNPSALQHYARRYTKLFSPDVLQGIRVGIYEHSSVARDCLRNILTALGATVVGLARTDTFVPIDTAVSEEDNQRGLMWSNTHHLDAIISTDGDGDRPLIADESGYWLRGDLVGLLCAKFLAANTVVTPVSCNTAIEASGLFDTVIRTRIGSPYVIAGMEQAQASGKNRVVGFEANGGFLVGSGLSIAEQCLQPLPTRDAVLPILAILVMAQYQGGRISTLLKDLPQRYTASNRIQNFPASHSKDLLEKLQHDDQDTLNQWAPELGSVAYRDLTDGLRMTFKNGNIVHLRPSGNAPELRCYAEADTMIRAQTLVNVILTGIKLCYGSV
jgi:phosphomannomutase